MPKGLMKCEQEGCVSLVGIRARRCDSHKLAGDVQTKPRRKYTRRKGPTPETMITGIAAPGGGGKYGAVIADLEAKKALLEKAIEALRDLP